MGVAVSALQFKSTDSSTRSLRSLGRNDMRRCVVARSVGMTHQVTMHSGAPSDRAAEAALARNDRVLNPLWMAVFYARSG